MEVRNLRNAVVQGHQKCDPIQPRSLCFRSSSDGYPVDVLAPQMQIPHPAKYGRVPIEGEILSSKRRDFTESAIIEQLRAYHFRYPG